MSFSVIVSHLLIRANEAFPAAFGSRRILIKSELASALCILPHFYDEIKNFVLATLIPAGGAVWMKGFLHDHVLLFGPLVS